MRHPYRCNRCRTRFSLRRRQEQYLRPPACPCCGDRQRRHFDADEARKRSRPACHCDGHHFPHRRGSLGCNHYNGLRDALVESVIGREVETTHNAATVPF